MERCTTHLQPDGGLPHWWADLFGASGSDSVFLTPAWIQAWVETYGAHFSGQWVHWHVNGRVVAGCLLIERVNAVRRIPFRSLFLNATGDPARHSPLAEFNDILCLPEYHDAVAEDLARLIDAKSWSRLLLCGYEPDSVCNRLLGALLPHKAESVSKPTRHVDLLALGDTPFHSTLKGKAGTHVRRNIVEYSQQLGTLAVRAAASLEEALGFLEEMRTLHVRRWQQRGNSTSMADSTVVAFHRRVIGLLWGRGVELLRVGSDEVAVGFLYNFVIDGKVFVYQTGFSYEASSKWSPGLLVHALAVEHYRQRGLREYDLMSGDALYKRTLSNGSRDLIWTVVYRDRLWIRMLLAARRLRSRLVEARAAPAPA